MIFSTYPESNGHHGFYLKSILRRLGSNHSSEGFRCTVDRCGSVKTVLRSFGGARGTFFGLKLLPVEFTIYIY